MIEPIGHPDFSTADTLALIDKLNEVIKEVNSLSVAVELLNQKLTQKNADFSNRK